VIPWAWIAGSGCEGLVEVLSRRNALLGTSFTGLTWPAAAQTPRPGQEADVAVVAPDGRTASMQIANGVVARLGASASHLHTEGSRGVADAVARLDDRSRVVAAILPSTALAFMEQTGSPSRDVHARRFIAQLDILTFQVLASQRIGSPRQLSGQKVNLGPRGSPTHISAAVLLDQTSLRVDPLYLDHEQACAAVIRGDISAMMLLAPKPAHLFFDVDPSDDVHFIPLPEPKGGRAAGILAAQILPADYPMIGGGNGGARRRINTVAVPLVLGCFGWAAESTNFMALARLADLLAKYGSGLPGFDMTAPVSGWQRFAPVADWLEQGKSGSIQDYAAAETRPPAPRSKPAPPAPPAPPYRPPSAATPEPDPKERLFQQFLSWRRNR
jgi:uncharacterized protein